MERAAAEDIAIRALEWIAKNDELMGVFLGSTGTSADDIRTATSDAGFLGGVLDFILMDDQWVQDFCRFAHIDPLRPMQARAALPGGDQVHWT